MLTKDFITREFPALNISDSVEYALSLMDELKAKHLPVVADGIYQCLLSEKDLLATPDPAEPVGKDPVLFAPSVSNPEHVHEVIAQMVRYRLTVLPVVSPQGKYKGAITCDKLLEALSDLCNAEAAGSVVVIELALRDYALSDIARIVEANNAHVLNLLSSPDKSAEKLVLTIKTDLEDATPLVRSFERFNYTVLSHFMEKGMAGDVLQRRMDELLFYMNM
jgi:CBS domain-containing protein